MVLLSLSASLLVFPPLPPPLLVFFLEHSQLASLALVALSWRIDFSLLWSGIHLVPWTKRVSPRFLHLQARSTLVSSKHRSSSWTLFFSSRDFSGSPLRLFLVCKWGTPSSCPMNTDRRVLARLAILDFAEVDTFEETPPGLST